jgi:phosphoribosylformylglycinamidine cyclo-ligase
LILSQHLSLGVSDPFPGAAGTVADVMLKVHRSYLRALGPVLDRVHAMAHITGGGLPGNVNRALPPAFDARIDRSTWPVPNEFRVLQAGGGIADDEMFRTFNMGVGMVVLTDAASADAVMRSAEAAGVRAWRAGQIVKGRGNVVLE